MQAHSGRPKMTGNQVESPNEAMLPLLMRLSLPLLAVMLMQVGQSVANTAWLSRIDLKDGTILAGVGLVFPLGMIVYALANGLQVGVGAALARAVGGGDRMAASRIVSAGLLFAIAIGLGLVWIGFAYRQEILTAQGAQGSMREIASAYYLYSLPGVPALALVGLFMGLYQGLGKIDLLVKGGLIGTFANAILDPVLIFTFDMGIRGAALATVAAQYLALLYLSLSLLKISQRNQLFSRFRRPPIEVLGRVLRGGGAQALMQLCIAGSLIFYNRMVVHISSDALTAFTICGRIDYLLLTPIFAAGMALVTVVGQSVGAGQPERGLLAWRTAVYATAVAVFILAGVQVLLAPIVYGLLSEVPNVIHYAVLQTRIMVLFFPMISVSLLASEALQALGKPALSIALTAMRHVLVPVPVALVAVYLLGWGIIGVYVAAVAGIVASAGSSVILIRRSLGRSLLGR